MQWGARPADTLDRCCLGPVLPVCIDALTIDEVTRALKRMRNGRAAGPDGIRAEYLKALLSSQSSVREFTSVLNVCWQEERTPSAWLGRPELSRGCCKGEAQRRKGPDKEAHLAKEDALEEDETRVQGQGVLEEASKERQKEVK